MADPTPFISVRWQGGEIGGMVQSVNVEDHDRLIDRARIVVDDPREVAGHIVDVGQTVQVDLGWSDDHAILFEGEVTRAVPETTGGRRRVTITALDFGVRLRRHERSPDDPPYRGKLSEIVRRIASARDYGFVVSPDNIKPDPDPEFTEDNELLAPYTEIAADRLVTVAADGVPEDVPAPLPSATPPVRGPILAA